MDLKTTVYLLLFLGICHAHPGHHQGADNEVSEVNPAREDITTTILKMNKDSRAFLVEGDISISRTRTAMRCLDKQSNCRWPKSANGNVVIPFTLSDKYDESEKHEILQAMRDFSPKTCIRFVPRGSQRAYLNIIPKYGCSSLLGHVGDRQSLSLARSGCIRKGIILHELLHALGFYHEHSRSDRDNYIRINWENVKSYFVSNFKVENTDNLNVPYDYASILHYGRTAFGAGLETITPIPDPTVPIGQREGLSDLDIVRVNRLYQCFGY